MWANTNQKFYYSQASLPSLTEQIQIRLSAVRMELRSYGQGPPLEPEKMGAFLNKVSPSGFSTDKTCHLMKNGLISDCFCAENPGVQ